jgi:hypothetical protein
MTLPQGAGMYSNSTCRLLDPVSLHFWKDMALPGMNDLGLMTAKS